MAHDALLKALKGRDLNRLSHDEWDALISYETSEAVGEWLIENKNLSLKLDQLRRVDLQAMADRAVMRFIILTNSAKILGRPLTLEVDLTMAG